MPFFAGSSLNSVSRCRRVKEGILLSNLVFELTNWAEVVKNPKGTAVGSHDKVVVFDDQIVHRCGRQVQLQRTPVRTVVERNINTFLRPGIKQSALLWIFPNYTDEAGVGNSGRKFYPGLAVILGLIDIGMKVVTLMAISGHERGTGVEGRRVDLADAAPLWQVPRSYIRPGFSLVACNLDQTVIRANPEQASANRRFSQSKDRVVILRTGVIQRNVAARNLLLALVVPRQVRTDCLPVDTTVCGLKQTFPCVVQRVGIMRREHYWRSPLEPMFKIRSPMRIRKLRLFCDRLHLPDTLVEARDVSLVVGRVNNVGIRRIRSDIAGFAATHVIPV